MVRSGLENFFRFWNAAGLFATNYDKGADNIVCTPFVGTTALHTSTNRSMCHRRESSHSNLPPEWQRNLYKVSRLIRVHIVVRGI